jgi:hypothetical protein
MSRERQYFIVRQSKYNVYKELAKLIHQRGYQKIGLVGTNSLEYALWYLLKKENSDIVIIHEDVNNITGKLKNRVKPDVLLVDVDMAGKYIREYPTRTPPAIELIE